MGEFEARQGGNSEEMKYIKEEQEVRHHATRGFWMWAVRGVRCRQPLTSTSILWWVGFLAQRNGNT